MTVTGLGRQTTTGAIFALTATLLLGGAVLGAHHLEGENEAAEAKPAKIIVIAPDEFTGLVGAKRTFWASICNEDGSGCKDANKAKWSVVPKNGLKLSKKKGVQILAQGKRAGTYELTARQNGVRGTATVKINAPLERVEPAPVEEFHLYVSPGEAEIRIGETIFLTAWECPLGEFGRLGENDVPDGSDDDCRMADIVEVVTEDGTPIALIGPQGPHVGITLTGFPSEIDGAAAFIGAQVVTAGGAALASIIARSEALAEFKGSKRPIGDLDGDGEADDDPMVVWSTFFRGEYEPAFDTDENGLLDEADWTALTGLETGMPTPPPARPAPEE